jgi:hypothetical protein
MSQSPTAPIPLLGRIHMEEASRAIEEPTSTMVAIKYPSNTHKYTNYKPPFKEKCFAIPEKKLFSVSVFLESAISQPPPKEDEKHKEFLEDLSPPLLACLLCRCHWMLHSREASESGQLTRNFFWSDMIPGHQRQSLSSALEIVRNREFEGNFHEERR